MNIYLDNVIYSKVKNGGVSNYWFELSKYLLEQPEIQPLFFENESARENFHRKQLDIPKENIISLKNESKIYRLLPIQFKTNEKHIYHSSYYRGLQGAKNQIEVTTVYDFIHSHYASFINKNIHNFLKFNAIKRSKGVLCISKNTYDDLQKFCPTKKTQKTEVIYVGVSNDYYPLKNKSENIEYLNKNNIYDDYILYVGGRTNYKNFDFCAALLNSNQKIKLVIVGGGLLSEKEMSLFTPQAQRQIRFIPSASNVELNILFNNALALLYPSSYEGFGIPVVEAMRAGCPVIGLNNATIQEVAPNAALLLNKLDVEECNKHLANLKTKDLHNQIIQTGFEESKKYSWEKCSKETLEFYKSLY